MTKEEVFNELKEKFDVKHTHKCDDGTIETECFLLCEIYGQLLIEIIAKHPTIEGYAFSCILLDRPITLFDLVRPEEKAPYNLIYGKLGDSVFTVCEDFCRNTYLISKIEDIDMVKLTLGVEYDRMQKEDFMEDDL